MDWQNLSYALIQLMHNFGAAAVVGAPLFALWPNRPSPETRRSLAKLTLIGWMVQGISGTAFGAVSYYYYGRFPDIHGIAVAALLIKMACAVAGFVLAALYLRLAWHWDTPGLRRAWSGLFALGATALTSAAFLRWFS